MLELDLSGSLMNRGARSLSACIHNIEKLNVSYCEMNKDAIKLLADGIKKRSKPVKYYVQSECVHEKKRKNIQRCHVCKSSNQNQIFITLAVLRQSV